MAHFSIEIKPRKDDFDENGYFKADRIFYYFQEVAGQQIEGEGFSPEELIKQGLIWVLAKMKIVFKERLREGGTYIFTTFPKEKKRTTFMRGYYINRGEDGPDPEKSVAIAFSQWTVLDVETRKPARNDLVFDIPENEIDLIPGPFAKIHSQDPQFVGEYTVSEQDIDFNEHTNNSRYISLAEEFIDKSITDNIYACYTNESKLGDSLKFYTEEREDGTLVEIRNLEDNIVFQAVFN